MPGGQSAGNHTAGFHAKNGAQPLAAGKHAVTHRLMDGDRMLGDRGQKTFERRVGQRLALLQGFLEHEGGV